LRDAYNHDLDALLHETLTPRKRLPAIVLLVTLVAVAIAIIISLFIHHGFVFYTSSATLLVACRTAAAWIARDLWRGKFARKSSYKMADLFYCAAGMLTVLALISGIPAKSDPATTFGALFPFVWMVTCLGWSLLNRIAAAELAGKEQMLRI